MKEKPFNFKFEAPKPKFKIKDVTFDVAKLGALEGWHLSEKIREALALRADTVEMPETKDAQQEAATAFVKSILTLPPAFVDEIREALFSKVTFKTKDVEAGWLDLDGAEDMAFENLEPYHIYEVLGRCLLVNFHGSFSDVALRFKGVMQAFKQLKP